MVLRTRHGRIVVDCLPVADIALHIGVRRRGWRGQEPPGARGRRGAAALGAAANRRASLPPLPRCSSGRRGGRGGRGRRGCLPARATRERAGRRGLAAGATGGRRVRACAGRRIRRAAATTARGEDAAAADPAASFKIPRRLSRSATGELLYMMRYGTSEEARTDATGQKCIRLS